ncbi:sensor histidine kinase [Deinococcus altitudinis]|uniref:sensor histidine kinase n=1 Tax=Deinococcus altitudinis TaxID=468914 RepID=UPI00389154B8
MGRSLNLALERTETARQLMLQNAELQARILALEGFALLSRDSFLEHDPVSLVGCAQELIPSLLPEGISTYYELQDERWNLLSHQGIFQSPELLWILQLGVPRGGVLNLDRPLDTRMPFYQERFDVATTVVARKEFGAVGATAALPVFVAEQVQGVVVFGLYREHAWLALERAQATRALLEQRDVLDRQTASLSAANEELQAFSYSVSHDLHTPVRHMLGFLKLARGELAGQLNERSARYLDVVRQSAEQMNTLIDAMLDLSNTAQQTLRPRAVDLNQMMVQIQATLAPDLLSRNIRWEMTALPIVEGDWDALKQVLTQLTENAVKFTQTRDPAVIRVWAEDQGEAWKVSVQDNGLGFDPQYQDRLFNLFQRLHTAQEAKGTGVGLASVRRLILKHGGQVFAEGQVDQGATFGFTLPKSSSPRP